MSEETRPIQYRLRLKEPLTLPRIALLWKKRALACVLASAGETEGFRMKSNVVTVFGIVGLVALAACAGHKGDISGFDNPSAKKTPDKGAGPAGGSADGGMENPLLGGDFDGGGANGCNFFDSTDHDGDGFSANDGDCNDCDPNMNPGAYDVDKNGLDEDCNGVVDDEPKLCDTSLNLDSVDAYDGAKAAGLCRKADDAAKGKARTWGVVSARYVRPDGTAETIPVSHGLLDTFGVNKPQEGARVLALSSGSARAPGQAGYKNVSGYDKGYTSGTPAGYPKESPACPGVTTGEAHDGAGLELKIRVPTNAKSFSFQENFFTYEFPTFICSTYNDFYVAMLTPIPKGLADGNIAFDQQNNPISVNNSLLQVCQSQTAGSKNFPCPLGAATLNGTGFEGHAATGWLKTQAPAKAGDTITLLFTIWDSGDGVLDSSVLVDKFEWSVDPATGASTTPVPPK
jgi:hypothetical protein